jgi:GntR family transcriptional regulator
MVTDALVLQLGPLSLAAPEPLYSQIVLAVKREVSAGRLPPGTLLPSYRVLAEGLMVSVITVKRAYEDLEREGIIRRRQGLGTFVAEHGGDRSREAARTAAARALADAARAGVEAGLSDHELQSLFKQALLSLRSKSP